MPLVDLEVGTYQFTFRGIVLKEKLIQFVY